MKPFKARLLKTMEVRRRYSKSLLKLWKPFRGTVYFNCFSSFSEKQFHFNLTQCSLLINEIISSNQSLSYYVTSFAAYYKALISKQKCSQKMLLKDGNIWRPCIKKYSGLQSLFFNLSFLMPICICSMMDLYLCFSCYSTYMQGREQEWSEQPVQDRSKKNICLWLRVSL